MKRSRLKARGTSHWQDIMHTVLHADACFPVASQSDPIGLDAGAGTQQDFLLKDTCILVDDKDVVQGSASKYDCHRFVQETPTGALHRAFSVFLFDSQNRLLLQQRASSKVTFPEVRGSLFHLVSRTL